MKRLLLTVCFCVFAIPAFAEDWPQYLGAKRDGVWREDGILEKFPKDGPKKVWSIPCGAGYAGPSVQGGKVFITDRVSKDGDGQERIVALDAKTGEELWRHQYARAYTKLGGYASGPRCTPLVDGERVYALGAMGDFFCLDASNGKVIWQKDFVKDYAAKISIWGFASHPVIDGDKLICLTGGTKENLVIAFDKKTGKEIWKSQSTEADSGYSAVQIYTFGGVRTAVVWHGAAVVGLDPETGKRLWKQDFSSKYALTAPTPRQLDDKLFITAFYDGPLMLKIGKEKEPTVLWKGNGKGEQHDKTDKLNSIMPTPFIKDGHIYGVCSYGELRCLKAETGERVWSTRKPTVGKKGQQEDDIKPVRWGNAFLVEHADRFFLFNEQGELIIAKLTPKGYEEIDRALIVEPTNKSAGRPVVWVYPAFANKRMYVKNDKELVCVELAK